MLDDNTTLDVHLLVKFKDIKRLSQKLYKDHSKSVQFVGGELTIGQVKIQTARHTFSREFLYEIRMN